MELFLTRESQDAIMNITPAHIKAGVDRAHAAGPVPSSVGVLRDVTFRSLQQQARAVEDPVIKYIASLDNGEDDGEETSAAMDYCLAVYDSHEDYAGVNNSVRRALVCCDVGEDHTKAWDSAPLIFWQKSASAIWLKPV